MIVWLNYKLACKSCKLPKLSDHVLVDNMFDGIGNGRRILSSLSLSSASISMGNLPVCMHDSDLSRMKIYRVAKVLNRECVWTCLLLCASHPTSYT